MVTIGLRLAFGAFADHFQDIIAARTEYENIDDHKGGQGNGDGCCEEIEVLLRDNPVKIAAQKLLQLPTQMSSTLEERAYIFGYEQKQVDFEINAHSQVLEKWEAI